MNTGSIMDTNRLYKSKTREMSKFFYWMCGIALVFVSCGKDIDLFIPRSEPQDLGDISRLKDRLISDISGDISYTFQVPCDGDKVFTAGPDVVVVIPPGFVDLSSYPCTNGFFEIDITVCDSKGEIMIAGIPTISEGKLLESRIELNLKIRDGSQQLKLAPGKQIGIKVNDPDPRERMELFYGNHDNTEWIQADGNPETWDNVSNGDWIFQDSFQNVITGFGYVMNCDSLDWINIDVFFDIPQDQRTDVCIELPDEFTNKNTAVFMVLDDYKSILPMQGNADFMKFCEPYGSAPIGFNVTFIVISEISEDNYMFATKSTSVTSHHSELLTPLKTPYEEIKNFILQL